jgi:hypothetical protein
MKKTLIAMTLTLITSLTGAAELTAEQEDRIRQVAIDFETSAYLSSRCLIDVRMNGPKGVNSEDCQAMVRASESLVSHQQFIESLPQEQEHEAVPGILRYSQTLTGNLDRITAILRAY